MKNVISRLFRCQAKFLSYSKEIKDSLSFIKYYCFKLAQPKKADFIGLQMASSHYKELAKKYQTLKE